MTTIGFLYPGYGAEDDYPYLQGLMPAGLELRLVHTSVGVDAHEVGALLDLGRPERLLAGARELSAAARGGAAGSGADPDSVIWACTSGSFVFGLEGARAQAAQVGDALGVPASSTSLAFVDTIAALGAERVAIAATYPEPVAVHFRTLLEDAGVSVASLVAHDIVTAELAGALDPAGVVDLALSHDAADADVVLLPDTAMHSARQLDALESACGKPVLTANQVTLWQGLRLAGVLADVPEDAPLGSLFHAVVPPFSAAVSSPATAAAQPAAAG